MQKADQQVLDLQGPVTPTFDNYIAGPNQVLVGMLQQLALRPEGWHYLSGQPSTGKTHLLLAVMHAAEQNDIDVRYLSLSSETLTDALINDLQPPELLLIDDIQAVKSSSVLQEAVFHCLNRMHQQKSTLIMTSCVSVGELDLQLPDLQSRLAKCQRHKIKALNDELFAAFIKNYLSRYDLPIEHKALDYLFRHGPRNMKLLVDLLQAIVKVTLMGKRKITTRLISDLFK